MTKQVKPKFLLIKKTIFPFDILIAVSTYDEVCKYIEKKKDYDLCDEEKEKLEMEGNGKAVMLKGGQTIIRLPQAKTSIGVDFCDLVHEIEHAVFFICDRIGIKHTNDSDELFAYYQAYITREALNFFNKK